MRVKRPKGSICVPVFNESENLPDLYIAFCRLADRLGSKVNLELVFTDNSSSDKSWEIIRRFCAQDTRVRGFRFGRNIGYQKSILFNFQQSDGQFVVQFDADLQDPPEVIDKMVMAWLDGHKLVSGRREDRSEGFAINTIRRLGYRLLSRSSEGVLAPDVGDFRLIDREVLKYVLHTSNPSPYLRGMISKLGFSEHFIDYRRNARSRGESKFPLIKVLSLGWNGFLSYSKWPIVFYNFVMTLSLFFSITLISSVVALRLFNSTLSLESFILLIAISVAIVLSASSSAIILFYLRQMYEVIAIRDLVYVENDRLERVDYPVLPRIEVGP